MSVLVDEFRTYAKSLQQGFGREFVQHAARLRNGLRLQAQTRPARGATTAVQSTTTRLWRIQVVAWREFDATVTAVSDDPYGGMMAANQAVRTVIAELAAFCANAISGLPQTRP